MGDSMDWRKTILLESDEAKPGRNSTKRRQEEREALKCPRCESTNTKFCYYNNYNKTQPRHFCRGCKRHWTNGGTLRNVPVGGGLCKTKRRLKRHSHVSSTSTSTTTTNIMSSSPPLGFRRRSHKSDVELVTKGFEWSGPNNFGRQEAGLNNDHDVITWDITNSTLVVEEAAAADDENQKPATGLITFSSSFDHQIPSTSFASLNNNGCETREEEDSSTIFPIVSQPWQVPITTATGTIMESPNYWNWNIDVDTMLLADLNLIPNWDNIDDSQFKP